MAPQENLLARLIAAIYAIVDALVPVIETIENTPNRPWVERMRFGDRFWAIFRELFALTNRIEPEILSTNPTFPPLRPRAPGSCTKGRARPARAPRPLYSTTPISSRNLAKRLAALLHQLLCLAAEAGATLTTEFHHHAAQARAIAGCHALPPQTWERAG